MASCESCSCLGAFKDIWSYIPLQSMEPQLYVLQPCPILLLLAREIER
uniref:Uncharacterized protein n=1 Tax=Rhizophora mucronata TaxID=61149 RepID=A0A2P2K6V6_RHIMU